MEFFETIRRTGPDDNRIIKVPKGNRMQDKDLENPRAMFPLDQQDDHFYQENNAQGAGTKPVEHLSAARVVD